MTGRRRLGSGVQSSERVISTPKLVLFWTVLVLGTLAIAEGMVRVAMEPPGLYPKPQENSLLVKDPVRGYALKPGASVRYRSGGREVILRVNQNGFRDGPYAEALRAKIRVLAVGDSFTFGVAVDSADPWPRQLEALMRRGSDAEIRVVDAGVPGYSARQMRLVVQDLLPSLRPQVVVFGTNPETYWRVRGPYVIRGGQLVRSSVLPRVVEGPRGLYYSPYEKRPWLWRLDIWLDRHLELGAHLLAVVDRAYTALRPGGVETATPAGSPPPSVEEVRRLLAPMMDELVRADSLAEAASARFVVLLINPQQPDGSFAPIQTIYNQVVTEVCRKHSIPVVDPLPALKREAAGRPVFRVPDDYHWTRDAHGIAAAEVRRYLPHDVWHGDT